MSVLRLSDMPQIGMIESLTLVYKSVNKSPMFKYSCMSILSSHPYHANISDEKIMLELHDKVNIVVKTLRKTS